MNMVHQTFRRFLAIVFLVAIVLAPVLLRAEDAKPQAAGSGPNLRVVEIDDNASRLDMAVKLFTPKDGKGPTVALVSAIHIADVSFYEMAAKFLDAQDLVLFEGVGPGHAAEVDTPKGRVAMTNLRIRFIATMVERYKLAKKEYPAKLADLVGFAGDDKVLRGRVARNINDMWNRPFVYEKFAAGFMLSSHGADGKPGGEGENADLSYADQEPLKKEEIQDQGGIQNDLAVALGLTFQLNAVDTGKPNYRNADISLDQLKAKLGAGGDDQAEQLLNMMDGSSAMAGVVKMALGMIQGNPRMQATFKAIIMDMLAVVGDDMSKVTRVQPGMEGLMKVLIDERNQVVIDSLKAELAKAKPARTIAMWYGAGHMKDLEARLVDQLEYKHVASFWLPAITLDLSDYGVKKSDIQGMRNMVKSMLDRMKK